MAIPNLNEIWLARVVCQDVGQISINMLHYEIAGTTGTGATDQECATTLDNTAAPIYKAVISGLDSARYYGVDFRRQRPAPPFVPAVSKANTGSGTVNSETMAKQVCGIITKRTGFAGRKYRGRMYIPFPTETANTNDGTATTAYQTLLDAIGLNLLTPIIVTGGAGTTTLFPCLLHPDGSIDRITAWLSRATWGTQKRRGDYGRTNVLPF